MPKLLSKITFPNYKAVAGKLLLLFLLLFSYSSCTDQGCIEADDFGEYEQEIIFVKANALGESCEYDPAKSLSDASQGTGLKACFTSGNIVINDGVDPADHSSATGCSGFEELPTIKNLCIEQCRQNCINTNSADSASAEPDWVSTHKRSSSRNFGVTITPGAKIFIRAVGTVVLGGAKPETIFSRSTDFGLQSKKSDFNPSFMDVTGGSVKEVKFSGKWNNGTEFLGGNINSANIVEKKAAFNGSRALFAYVIPHPEGYKFDTSESTELGGTRGTPLYVDTRLWTCSYNIGNVKQSLCSSLPYNAHNEYPNTDNATALSIYNITSSEKASNLGLIGGMIRYNDDGLEPFDTDPFSSTSCNPNCSNAPSNPKVGGFVGNLSAGDALITNNETYAVRLVFKNLGAGTNGDNCNISLLGTIKDKDGQILTSPPKSIAVDKSVWSAEYISLEAGDKIEFASNASVYGASTTSCGSVIAYRLNKLQDIAINKSGFVSFTRIATSGSSGSCSLSARIINPLGNRVDFNGLNSADFYEYDSFSTPIASSIDPIKNLNVPISNATSPVEIFNKNWSNKFFVRKGQVIRFDPTSWNGTWVSGAGGDKECGIGTAMQIEERPAVLCRGIATENVSNPLCKQGVDVDGNKICQRYSDECFLNNATPPAPVSSSKYCPSESCQESFDASCIASSPFSITSTTCDNCLAAKNAAGSQSTTISLDLKQCYDLENYIGKVSNIDSITGFTPEQLDDVGISKGAKKIGSFDGRYGNFSNLVDNKANEGAGFNNNTIYRLSQPASFAYDGRLKFLIIDNNSFDDNLIESYTDNGGSASYDGLNGYKIDLSGRQEFKNGKWLEAILCRENTDDTTVCSSESIPIRVNDQPDIVNIANPLVSGQEPNITSYYQFDPFGSISRFDNLSADHVSPEASINTLTNPGDNFYRHGSGYEVDYTGMTDAQIADSKSTVSRLRISFKIKDPEIPDCKISAVNTAQPPFGQTCGADCDGIVVENRFYNGTIAGNTNTICASDKLPGGEATNCQKQFFCANKYYNNEGKYQVVVKVENKGSNISNIVNKVISPVIEIMDGSADGTKMGQAERVYVSIVNDGRFQLIVQTLLILMITFYGVGYLMGVSEFSQSEIISRIIKIGVIYLFISPDGWVWFDKFFVNFFKNGTDYVTFLMASSFDRSTELQNAIATNSFYDKSILFSGIDKVFGMFFSSAVQKKISALLFASIFGWAYLYIIYLSFFLYVYAVANSVLLYLTAQVFISILFVLGPLFFLTMLFGQTKEMFDKWLGELIGFSLQQIFLLTTLAFFNMMMYEIMKMSLGYRVCWDDVWVINIYITRIKLLSFWTIASLPPRLNAQSEVGNIGNPEGIPSIFSILFIWIVASLMHKFIGFMTDLGASIGGSVKASEMGAGVKAAGNAMNKMAHKKFNSAVGDKITSAVQSVDRALFDSGKKADDARKKRGKQDKADSKNRSTLAKAGDAGVSEYKRKNAAEYANMNEAQKKDALSSARKTAMQKKGEEMGLNPTETKKLIEGKSSITNARTIGGLAQEAWQKKGTLNSALVDKDVKTSLSGSEVSDAMKRTDDKGKVEIQQRVDAGDLKVKVTSGDRASYNLDQAKAQAKDLKIGSALVSVGKSIGQGMKSSTVDKAGNKISNVGSAIASAASSAKKTIKESDEHKQTRKTLESAGEISRQATGTGWARSNADKGKIKIQMDEDKKLAPEPEREAPSKSTDEFMAKLPGKQLIEAEKKATQSVVDSVGSGYRLPTIAESDDE